MNRELKWFIVRSTAVWLAGGAALHSFLRRAKNLHGLRRVRLAAASGALVAAVSVWAGWAVSREPGQLE